MRTKLIPTHLKFLLIAFVIISVFTTCKKDPIPDPDSIYFQCKVNGTLYIPSNCANCLQAEIIDDSTLILGANNGYTTLGTLITDLSGIKAGQYNLNEISGRRADYRNSSVLGDRDRYFTDSTHVGLLTISEIDKTKHIIKGTFYFKAFNAYANDVVTISDGRFRVNY